MRRRDEEAVKRVAVGGREAVKRVALEAVGGIR